MKQGLGLLALAAVLVLVALWMGASANPSIEGNSGLTAAAAGVVAIVGAVMVSRALIDRGQSDS